MAPKIPSFEEPVDDSPAPVSSSQGEGDVPTAAAEIDATEASVVEPTPIADDANTSSSEPPTQPFIPGRTRRRKVIYTCCFVKALSFEAQRFMLCR